MPPPDPVHIYVVSTARARPPSALVKAGLVLFRGLGELGRT